MSTPTSDQVPQGKGLAARLRAGWRRAFGKQLTAEQVRTIETQRNRAQLEVDRMDAHRHTGRFGGTNY